MERHRFLAVLIEGLGPMFPSARVVLEVAPSVQTGRILARTRPACYMRVDLDPGADQRDVDVRASLTALPLGDGSVDIALCYHVLEHIPDDDAAMGELRRVLAPGGVALVQVPWRPDQATVEEPLATPEERELHYGQHDHVRYYGRDFEDRLLANRLAFTRVTPRNLLGVQLCDYFALVPDECVWVVRRDDANPHDVRPRSMRLRTLPLVYDRMLEVEQELRELRSTWPVRAATQGRRLVASTADLSSRVMRRVGARRDAAS